MTEESAVEVDCSRIIAERTVAGIPRGKPANAWIVSEKETTEDNRESRTAMRNFSFEQRAHFQGISVVSSVSSTANVSFLRGSPRQERRGLVGPKAEQMSMADSTVAIEGKKHVSDLFASLMKPLNQTAQLRSK